MKSIPEPPKLTFDPIAVAKEAFENWCSDQNTEPYPYHESHGCKRTDTGVKVTLYCQWSTPMARVFLTLEGDVVTIEGVE